MQETDRGLAKTPKILSWFGVPSHIGETERFELLRKDIFLHEAKFDQLPGLWAINSRFTGYIFNLDRILEYLPFPRLNGVLVLARKLVRYLSWFCPHNCVVHTRILNEDLREVFKEAGIPLYQQNLEYRPTAWKLIKTTFLPIVSRSGRPERQFVRVAPPPEQEFRVSIRLIKDLQSINVHGTLNDLSLNGVGMKLHNRRDLNNIQLRDPVNVHIRNQQTSIHLTTAFITRRDEASRSVGLNFNISDESFVSRPDAVNLSRTVYQSLTEATGVKIKEGLKKSLEIL